jgi:hypothetical protein
VASDFSASFNREQDCQNYDRDTIKRYRREEHQENNAIEDELKKSNEYGSEEWNNGRNKWLNINGITKL